MSKFPKRAWSEYFIDQDNIIHYFQATVETPENLVLLEKAAREIVSLPNVPVKALFDQRGINFWSQMPYRQKYIELTGILKNIKKVALLTDNRLLWIFLSFNFNAGKNMRDATMNVKPFISEEEAMKWLKQD